MARTGRPLKADEARNKALHIRLTQSEFNLIEKKAKEHNQTKTELILEAVQAFKK